MRVEHTKKLIADALTELMKAKKFDHISVGDIADLCGVSRHTFYYHFEDKYSLVKWTFSQFADSKFPIPDSEEIQNGRVFYIREIIDHMYEHKHFYINLFNSSAKDHIYNCLFDHISQFRSIQVDGLLRGRTISDVGRKFIQDYYTCAITGMIMIWAQDGMVDPLNVFFQGYKDIATQSIESLIDKYAV